MEQSIGQEMEESCSVWLRTVQKTLSLSFVTRQAMYVKSDIWARSFNHCGSRKVIIITYSECVILALNIQNEIRMRRIIL